MGETTQRVLRLLDLLQSRSVWTGPELADRLGVTTRSIRRDVERLRDLGYPVHATQGVGGGYRLGAGRALRALAKLDQVLPTRLRSEVGAIQVATDTIGTPGSEVDGEALLPPAGAGT